MKNRSFALMLAILMIAALLIPVCFADDTLVYPILGAEVEKDVALAPDASASESVDNAVPTTGATETDGESEDAPKMIFAPMNFVKNLYYMGLGMLGIFVVIGVIILATAVLNKTFKDKKDE